MSPAAHQLSNALNALLPPALCQSLLSLNTPGEASAATQAHWQMAQHHLEAAKILLRTACGEPALAAQAARLVQVHAGFAAAAQTLERQLRLQRP